MLILSQWNLNLSSYLLSIFKGNLNIFVLTLTFIGFSKKSLFLLFFFIFGIYQSISAYVLKNASNELIPTSLIPGRVGFSNVLTVLKKTRKYVLKVFRTHILVYFYVLSCIFLNLKNINSIIKFQWRWSQHQNINASQTISFICFNNEIFMQFSSNDITLLIQQFGNIKARLNSHNISSPSCQFYSINFS